MPVGNTFGNIRKANDLLGTGSSSLRHDACRRVTLQRPSGQRAPVPLRLRGYRASSLPSHPPPSVASQLSYLSSATGMFLSYQLFQLPAVRRQAAGPPADPDRTRLGSGCLFQPAATPSWCGALHSIHNRSAESWSFHFEPSLRPAVVVAHPTPGTSRRVGPTIAHEPSVSLSVD